MIELKYSIYLWSFKSDVHEYWIGSPLGLKQFWFFDHWSDDFYYRGCLGSSMVFMFLFVAQIFTLVISLASIFSANRVLALLPVLSCLTTIALMSGIGTCLLGRHWWGSYDSGYFLTYPAVLLFLLAFTLLFISKTKRLESPQKH